MIRQEVMSLREKVIDKNFTHRRKELFEGADVIITHASASIEPDGDYIVVKTAHARRLSALIFTLKDIFSTKIDYLNKYAFYGRLAEAANKYLKENPDDEGILLATLDEALCMAAEVERIKYFAYGSNMNTSRMSERCPGAIPIGSARLDGYKFALDRKGYATVVKSTGNHVWGFLWDISEDHKQNLDNAEGIHTDAYRDSYILVEQDTIQTEALIYISLREPNEGNRAPEYEDMVIQGAMQRGLPDCYIQELRTCFARKS